MRADFGGGGGLKLRSSWIQDLDSGERLERISTDRSGAPGDDTGVKTLIAYSGSARASEPVMTSEVCRQNGVLIQWGMTDSRKHSLLVSG